MSTRSVAVGVAFGLAAVGCVGGDAAAPTDDSTTVEVFGPFRGREAELLAASLLSFEQETGIEVRYTGTGSFVPDLRDQVRAADPPDVALVPQPGLIRELVDSGDVLPLQPETTEQLDANFAEEIRHLADVDGVAVGVPFQLSVKSLVWYRPEVFETHDLSIPTTLDELEMLLDGVERAGLTPWCLGIEAQAATGWVATDWTEELVLRRGGTDVYDGWVQGDVGFGDPIIEDAFEEFRALALVPGRAAGGTSGVLRTSHHVSPLGLFDEPPECVLHRQASFVFNSMPSGLEFGPSGDIHFFVFPGTEVTEPAPLLVGSTLAVSFDDRPAVTSLMTYLTTSDSTRQWAEAGGFLPPHSTVDIDELAPVDRAATALLREATIIRADASDAMEPAVGSDLLWQEITDWVAEEVTYDELAQTIDEARAG